MIALTGMRREAVVANMAHAGKELAVQWGHQPWSDSWAEMVAMAMLEAAEQMSAVLGSA